MNPISFIWSAPIFAALTLAFVVLSVTGRAKKTLRQISRLERIAKTIGTSESPKSIVANLKPETSLENAVALRDSLIKRRAKDKRERQRRLVRRLTKLTSKERE